MSVKKPKTLDEIWKYASEVVDDALRNLSDGIERSRYMHVYSDVFNFLCAHSDGAELYQQLRDNLKKYVKELVEKAEPLPDTALLKYFQSKWNDYLVSNKLNNNMFNYLNRTWVKTSKSNNEDVFEISMLADVIWKDHLFLPLHKRLTNAMLALIKAERDGENIETAIVSDTIQCYVRLGTNKENPKGSPLEVYKTYFETPFLEASDVYYTIEATTFLHENGVSEYMKKVQARMAEETQRVRTYLHRSSEKPLSTKLVDVLVRRPMSVLQQKAISFLEEDQRDDLKRLYELLAMVKDDKIEVGLDPVREVMQKHIAAVGRAALEAEKDKAAAEPDTFVAILLRVYRQYKQLIQEATNDDAGFVAAQDKAFRDFVNSNCVTDDTSKGKKTNVAKAPQHLAKYCDMILRKGAKHISDEQEMERTLEDVVSLFKYLPDKDVFMLVYSKLLSKRLIHDNSGNNDFEATMIAKLKNSQGFEYTSKLQRMIQDIATSRDINVEFRESLSDAGTKLPLDFSVNVLATGCWPLQPPATGFNVPAAVVDAVAAFKKFYNTKYSGRKLTYLHHLSKAELQVTYAMRGRLRIMASTFQMGVLLHFDTVGKDVVSFGDLRGATLLEEKDLKIAILSLLKVKFMKSSAGPRHTTWDDSTQFSLNKSFQSKRNRVNVNVPVSVEGLRSAAAAPVEAPEVRRERELKLQAAIVRVMKARKVMDHNLLVSETTTAVSKWFQPRVSHIKKVIEYLIEQGCFAVVCFRFFFCFIVSPFVL